MNDLPVILSYFAQSVDNTHLPMLEQEQGEIQVAWEMATEQVQNPIAVKYIPRGNSLSNRNRIVMDIKTFNKRIVLFQFSGHAGPDALQLNDGQGGPDPIAGLLQECATNLKVVVLNGCSTHDQVKTFFDRGIPAVVATSCAVKDSDATLFSITFHQALCEGKSIEEAYHHAILVLKLHRPNQQTIQTLEETSIVVNRSMLDTSVKKEKIWGLFVSDKAKSLPRDSNWWRLDTPPISSPTSPSMGKLIREDWAYTCDRTNYGGIFNGLLYPNGTLNPNTYQHYLIIGEDAQSPLGLARKLSFERITSQNQLSGQYYYSCDPTDPGKRINYIDLNRSHTVAELIMRAIYERIPELPFSPPDTKEQLFINFQQAFSRWKFVIIAVRIRQDQLTAGVTTGISQFMEQLERVSAGNPSATRFLFFWNVSYNSARLPDSFQQDPVGQIIKLFAPIPIATRSDTKGLWLLNEEFRELDVPTETDIDNWLEDYLMSSINLEDSQKTSICQIKDVKELENKLIKLIAEANRATTANLIR